MKVIFLDIDGVLNGTDYEHNLAVRHPANDPWWDDYLGTEKEIDSTRVEKLNRLVRETGAKIVISSAWREDFDIDVLRSILRRAGLRADIIGMTAQNVPDPESASGRLLMRGGLIKHWLDNTRDHVEAFVVLDDTAGQRMVPIRRWLVRTSSVTGLNDAQVDKAIAVLNRQDRP